MSNLLKIYNGTSYTPRATEPTPSVDGDLFYSSGFTSFPEGFYVKTSTGWEKLAVASDISSGITGKADTDLGNLSSTAINSDLVPDGVSGRSLGSSAIKWINGFIFQLFCKRD